MRHENGSWHEGILKDINHMQERSIDMREAHFHIKLPFNSIPINAGVGYRIHG